ncbi:MAG: DUF1275 domain-containing protein [Clostridiales bacterium]|nr:DUF1275 domain-containing protein [Clostridiales bacterium]
MKVIRWIRQEAATLWIFALVFMAGALNAAGWLQYGQTLSHMTGNLTKLGLTMTGQSPEPFWWFFLFIISFILGATVSGYAFPTHSRGQWRRCGLVLVLSGALLLVSALVHALPPLRMTMLALVLGAQNGLALRYRGILTRTTHVTGHLTDLGAAIGRMVKARAFEGENLRAFILHLCALLFFLLGVVTISLTHSHLPGAISAIDLCGFLYALLGILMLQNLWKA